MRTPLRVLTAASLAVPLALLACDPSLAASKGHTRTADTTLPSVSISSPAAGSTTGSSLTVTGTASDNAGVASVSLQVDGGAWQPASGTTSWSVPLSGFTAGSHTVTAKAADTSGNTRTTSSTFTVADPTPSPSPSPSPTSSPSPSPSPSPTSTTSPTPAPTSTSTSSSTAPDTQGTWTSPEGATISVQTTGPWTISSAYQLLLRAAAGPGDFARVAPHVQLYIQDTYTPMTSSSAVGMAPNYTSFTAAVYLKGNDSSFISTPDWIATHEYGHAWTLFHYYMDHGGDWSQYLGTRWSSTDGSLLLGQDTRLNSAYEWMIKEIIADDYRLLFGDAAAVSASPNSLNPYIEPPAQQPGLKSWFLSTWM